MPRPGPRPYECVRRAWHSDRHQPIRGTLIQEIFRVANEVHNPTTRKNKEWQEKLPFVVLKAEEIMYSKANSEAEYLDPKTLWDRTNDAIDTIIRREDTNESGDLLQPCIEAALNLGCIPRRASRSQRHNNPGCYLSSTVAKEATAASLKIHDDNNKGAHYQGSSARLLPPPPLPPPPPPQPNNLQLASWYSVLVTPTTLNNGSPEVNSLLPDASFERKDSFPFPSAMNSLLPCQDGGLSVPIGTCTWPSLGRVYPLYYGDDQSKASSQLSFPNPQDPIGNTVTVSVPFVLPSIGEAGIGFLHNFLGSSSGTTSSNFGEASENPLNNGCNLSLCLGIPSPPSLDADSSWTHEVEDVGSSSSCGGSKFSDPSPSRPRAINYGCSFSSPQDKGFDFFPIDTTEEPLESCSSKWSSEGEGNTTRGGF